jgi:hypothetical protein
MANRLIENFKKQTKNSILEHMDKLAVNNTVYSTHFKGYEPHLKEKNIFIYIHASSMVVVCFDLCGQIEEIAEEESPYGVGRPEYYSSKGPRISPVYRLSESIKEKYANDFLRRNEAEAQLDSEMRNQNTALRPYEVIDRIIEPRDREYFYRRVIRDDIPTNFRKNISLIEGKMMRRSMSISDQIKIFAPQDIFQDDSFIIDRETDNDYVIVKIAKNRV